MSDFNINDNVLRNVGISDLSDIVYSLSSALRYELEGDRGADSVEAFVEDWLQDQINLITAIKND